MPPLQILVLVHVQGTRSITSKARFIPLAQKVLLEKSRSAKNKRGRKGSIDFSRFLGFSPLRLSDGPRRPKRPPRPLQDCPRDLRSHFSSGQGMWLKPGLAQAIDVVLPSTPSPNESQGQWRHPDHETSATGRRVSIFYRGQPTSPFKCGPSKPPPMCERLGTNHSADC